MIDKFYKLSSFQQEPYLKKARFLLERRYVRDLTEIEIAANIYNTQNPNKDEVTEFIKGMIT
jgi:hypothetical protein